MGLFGHCARIRKMRERAVLEQVIKGRETDHTRHRVRDLSFNVDKKLHGAAGLSVYWPTLKTLVGKGEIHM